MKRLASLLLSSSFLLAQNPPSFKVEATYVKVPVTVFDSNGRVLSDLTREQFRLLDEGEPRTIENFVLDKTSVHVLLLLDVSGSVQQELDEIREAALRFARSFGKEDRIAVISFADEMEVLQDWTNNLRQLRKSLKDLRPGYRTALYDVLLATAREKLARVPGKKVVILLTDGLDNESQATFDDVIDPLIESNISLYIVSRTRLVQPQIQKSERVDFLNQVMKNVLHEEKDFVDIYFREKETSMSYVAEATGGRAFFPKKLEDLKDSYLQLATELKHQYILTFRPPGASDKQFRAIQVICTRLVGKIYHRKRYSWIAPADN
ncbi:VWA domain-containing protein [Acidobacteria bacterium AH-259-A15]|nr:VWA domain-containing protein [Acidobacteria bacterium AH-259-A15]